MPQRLRKLCWSGALIASLFARAGAQQLQRQNWTTEEGLPQNSVHAMLQSGDGYLWVATEGGVARFNGLRFTRFFTGNESAFISNDICCIAQGSSSSLYFGTANGVVLHQDGAFSRINGLSGAVVGMQRETGGAVLALMEDGLVRMQGGVVSHVSLPAVVDVNGLGAAADGSVLAVASNALYRIKSAGLEPLAHDLPVLTIGAAEDREHHLWIRSASEVVLLTPERRVQARWTVGRELAGSRVESLTLWPGGVLAGTNRGAYVLRAGAAPLAIDLLRGDAVLSAMVDREGGAWFGTDSGGLSTLRQKAIETAAPLQGEPVTAVVTASDGSVWAGTRDAGLRHFHVGDTTAAPVAGLASQVILALAADGKHGVWVGTPEGVDHVQAGRVEHVTAAEGLPDDFVRSLLAVPDGSVWVGTRHGVAEYREGHVARVLAEADGLPSDVVGAMLRDRNGSVWVGTMAGLARVDRAGVHRVLTGDKEALVITSLGQSADGTVWVGTADGLKLVNDGRLLRVPLLSLQQEIAAAVPDALGNLWLRIDKGIVRARASDLLQCATAGTGANCRTSLRQYGVADGMPSVELGVSGHPMSAEGPGDTLWFTTRRGLALLHPGSIAPSPAAPGIAVEQAVLDDRLVPFVPDVLVEHGKRRLEIVFAGLSLRAPGQVRYRYLLDGFDRDWSPFTFSNVAEYTNLPPGLFRFRVQALSADGVLSSTDATVLVRVGAPFYRRWWFYALLLLLAGAIAYGLYWLRLRRVRRDFATTLQERNRIAREIHDTLAQDFVAISLQLEVTSQLLQVGANAAAKEQVDATRGLVRDGIRDARESIWALRAGSDAETLPARLQAMVNREPKANLHVTGAYRSLSPSQEQELFRVAKEAVGNATRHAAGASIAVSLVYSEDAVALRVSDDGAGFDVDAASARAGHYGVRGMRERAEAMGASFRMESAPGKGTTVLLTLPAGMAQRE